VFSSPNPNTLKLISFLFGYTQNCNIFLEKCVLIHMCANQLNMDFSIVHGKEFKNILFRVLSLSCFERLLELIFISFVREQRV